jgi:hypothetical protein
MEVVDVYAIHQYHVLVHFFTPILIIGDQLGGVASEMQGSRLLSGWRITSLTSFFVEKMRSR